MKINQINKVSFESKIIDAHAHFGSWGNEGRYFDMNLLDKFTKNELNIDINGIKSTDTVDKMLVSSLSSINEKNRMGEKEGLEEALKLSKNNDKIAILAVCEPNVTMGNAKELKSAINKAGKRVVGLKLHPRVLNKLPNGEIISASHKFYEPYIKLAEKKNLPCLFHCDGDISGANEIYRLAKKFKNVPIILGHTGAGGNKNFEEALNALTSSIDKKDAKLYCDISWLNWKDGMPDGVHSNVKKLITELKKRNALDRILFGTDAPLGCFGESLVNNISAKEAYEKTVSGLKSMIKKEFKEEGDDIINKIFYENAEKLFFKKNKTKTSKIIAFVFGGIALITGIIGLLNKRQHGKKSNDAINTKGMSQFINSIA